MTLLDRYKTHQTDLACLDTLCGDYSDYGVCLGFAWTSSSAEAVGQIFEANGALPWEMRERETEADCLARWFGEDAAQSAVAA